MKVTEQKLVTCVCHDGLTVEIATDASGFPTKVNFNKGFPEFNEIDAEIIERVAHIISTQRLKAGNFDMLCADHGRYHPGDVCLGCRALHTAEKVIT